MGLTTTDATLRFRSMIKSALRGSLRRLDYDIVPFRDSLRQFQSRLLSDVDLVVDVGANTGQYRDLVRSLGYDGRVVSFEPGSSAFEVLQRRAVVDPRWSVCNKAVGRTSGTAVLQISDNSVSSSMLKVMEEHLRAAPRSRVHATEVVETITLDEALSDTPGHALWLKLDVQGFEKEVLAGGPIVLGRAAVIQCELSLRPLYEDQADYLELMEILRGSGFDLVHVEPGYQDPESGRCLQVDGIFARPLKT